MLGVKAGKRLYVRRSVDYWRTKVHESEEGPCGDEIRKKVEGSVHRGEAESCIRRGGCSVVRDNGGDAVEEVCRV